MMSPGRSDFQGPTRKRLVSHICKVEEMGFDMDRRRYLIWYSPLLGDFDCMAESRHSRELRVLRHRNRCVRRQEACFALVLRDHGCPEGGSYRANLTMQAEFTHRNEPVEIDLVVTCSGEHRESDRKIVCCANLWEISG